MADPWSGPLDQYDEEFLRTWAGLRAMEWLGLPLFAAQPIAPVLLLFFPVWLVILGQWLISWPWLPFRYRLLGIHFERGASTFASPEFQDPRISSTSLLRFANRVQRFVRLKWPAAILAGAYLYYQGQILQGTAALLWPGIVLLLTLFTPSRGLTGVVQKRFLLALGFVPLTGEPSHCLIKDFHRW